MHIKIAVTATALLLSTAGFSQNPGLHPDGYKRKQFNLLSLDQPVVINDSALKRSQQLREAFLKRSLSNVQGGYSHKTLDGKVFILPPDNMPCMVPDKDQIARMPNANPPGIAPVPMPNNQKRKRLPSTIE